MVEDEDRGIARFNLLLKSRLLLQYLLEFGVVLLHVADGLGEAELNIVVVLVFEYPAIRDVRVF
jgi:hypothetical protein